MNDGVIVPCARSFCLCNPQAFATFGDSINTCFEILLGNIDVNDDLRALGGLQSVAGRWREFSGIVRDPTSTLAAIMWVDVQGV